METIAYASSLNVATDELFSQTTKIGVDPPIAAMADAFFNLAQIRAALKQAIEYKRIQHGARSVMVRRNASDATWERAERFLLGC